MPGWAGRGREGLERAGAEALGQIRSHAQTCKASEFESTAVDGGALPGICAGFTAPESPRP
jgi:hypothetical protein